MHPFLARNIYFGLQTIRREPVKQAHDELQRTLNWSLDQLRQLQAERLVALWRYVTEEVPYYREHAAYRRLRSNLDDMRGWETVRQAMKELPVLEKQEVIADKAAFLPRKLQQIPTTPGITSGSTGDPLRFPVANQSFAYRHAVVFRALSQYGIEIGEPYAYLFGLHWGKKSKFKARVKDVIFNRVRISAFDIEADTVRKGFQQLRRKRVTHLNGYPSAIYDFCTLCKDLQLDLTSLKLKGVMTTAEPLLDYQRDQIEKLTGAKCINFYGSVEGGTGAFEGPDGLLHQPMECTYLEVDEKGEIFTTDLFQRAFPLIRYRVGDYGVLANRRGMYDRPAFESITGRSGAPITLPNGVSINSHVPSFMFRGLIEKEAVRKYRFYQLESEKRIVLQIVPSPNYSDGARELIIRESRKAFGEDIPVEVELRDKLPTLSNAKHRNYLIVADRSQIQ